MIRHGLVCTTKEWHWKSVRRCATWWSSIPILARWQRVQFWTVSTLILWFLLLPAQIWADVLINSAILWRMRNFDWPISPTRVRHFRIYSKSEQATLRKLRIWANAGVVNESWIGITLPKKCGRDLPTLRFSSNVRFMFHSFIFSGMP